MSSTGLKLYVYDGCPFCVRARMIFGLKNVDFELLFVANHDEATPIGLIGAKMVPILQLPDGKAFGESMDIVHYVDAHFGGPQVLAASANREDLQQWLKASQEVMFPLVVPRSVRAPMPEFARRVSREYFTEKKEKFFGSFDALLAQSPELVDKMNTFLVQLEGLLHSAQSVNATLSVDDIDLFPRLRGLTIVKGIQWPPKVRAYLDHFAAAADIPLFGQFAM